MHENLRFLGGRAGGCLLGAGVTAGTSVICLLTQPRAKHEGWKTKYSSRAVSTFICIEIDAEKTMDITDTTVDVRDHGIVSSKAHFDVDVKTAGELYSTQQDSEMYFDDDAADDDQIIHEGLAVTFQVGLLNQQTSDDTKVPTGIQEGSMLIR